VVLATAWPVASMEEAAGTAKAGGKKKERAGEIPPLRVRNSRDRLIAQGPPALGVFDKSAGLPLLD